MMKSKLYLVTCFVILAMGCDNLVLPRQNVCFDKHILPLMERDCVFCHENGEYGVKLRGNSSDYVEITRYYDKNAPQESLFLAYAKGYLEHPIIWTKKSNAYKTMELWFVEGARDNCVDIATYGDCQADNECALISCVCPDFSVIEAQVCLVDPTTGRGECPNDTTCVEPRFGICSYVEPDVPDASPPDAEPDVVEVSDVVEDTTPPSDTALSDTLTDTTVDTQPETVPDTTPVEPDTADPQISFTSQIVPLLKSDCKSCHWAGQYNVKISGTANDYKEVMRYVDVNKPEEVGSFLWWAAGGGMHPISWPKSGSKYKLFLKWVQQGAKNN